MQIIQKVVILLDKFHIEEFVSYLEATNAHLPKKLVEIIDSYGFDQPETDELCERIYGKKDEKTKKNFFQLAHHTLKLTSFLARNYPSYLSHNISKIEVLLRNAKLNEATVLAEYLNDVAEKIEDRNTQLTVLKFLSQFAFLKETKNEAVRYHELMTEISKNELIFNQIYLYIRENLNYKDKKNLSKSLLKNHQEFFKNFENDECFSIKLLANFGGLFTLSFLNDESFYSKETFAEICELEKEMEKNSFVVFPYLEDFIYKIYSVKIQYLLNDIDSEKLLEETNKIIKSSEHVYYWKNFVNIPELFSLGIQTSYYISNNMGMYKKGYYENLSPDVKNQVNFLRKKCEDLIAQPIWNDGYLVKLINLKSFYAGLLLVGSPDDIKKSVKLFEGMLRDYQQISFQKFLDAIFGSLIIGYFSLQEHFEVSETYKRYKKLTADSSTNEENDITINTFYYASQWISTGKKQYQEKLDQTLKRARKNDKLSKTAYMIEDVIQYFKIPIEI